MPKLSRVVQQNTPSSPNAAQAWREIMHPQTVGRSAQQASGWCAEGPVTALHVGGGFRLGAVPIAGQPSSKPHRLIRPVSEILRQACRFAADRGGFAHGLSRRSWPGTCCVVVPQSGHGLRLGDRDAGHPRPKPSCKVRSATWVPRPTCAQAFGQIAQTYGDRAQLHSILQKLKCPSSRLKGRSSV